MKNIDKENKICYLDKFLPVWYNTNIQIEIDFFYLFITFDESPPTQLPCLSPPQYRVNSTLWLCQPG